METTPVNGEPTIDFEGSSEAGVGTISRDTTIKRSGTSSRSHTRGASFGLVYTTQSWGTRGLFGYYARMYFRVNALPSSTARIMYMQESAGGALAGARLTAAGKIQLFNETGSPAQIGSDSAATVTTDTWYRLELYVKTAAGATDACELRLDGVSVASGSGLSLSENQIIRLFMGWVNDAGANGRTFWIDDVAVNDDQGATNNTWPGEGSIVYLDPTADSALTGSWTAGAGATTSLFDAVNNVPAAGLAAGSATNTSQIKNTNTADTTGNYDATMQSYTTAGLLSTDTITLLQPVAQHGTSAGVNVTGGLRVVSNPAEAEESFSIGRGVAIGTYPTQWATWWGAAINSPSVTLGTQPVMRVGRRGVQAAEAHICGMRIAVEYTSGAAAGTGTRMMLLGVG
jgi:hypothetical protein